MKNNLLRTVCVAIAAFLVVQVQNAQAGAQDFTLSNETGVEIHEVYISPHSEDSWQEDVMGRDTLPAGESVEISFDAKENADNWDLKVTDKDGNSIVWENLKLTEITDVILHYEDGKAWADTKNGD